MLLTWTNSWLQFHFSFFLANCLLPKKKKKSSLLKAFCWRPDVSPIILLIFSRVWILTPKRAGAKLIFVNVIAQQPSHFRYMRVRGIELKTIWSENNFLVLPLHLTPPDTFKILIFILLLRLSRSILEVLKLIVGIWDHLRSKNCTFELLQRRCW